MAIESHLAVTIIMMITHYRNILCFPIKNTTEGILTSTAYVVAQHTSIVCILSCKLETKSLDERIEAPILQMCSPIYNNSALTEYYGVYISHIIVYRCGGSG